MVNQQLIDYIKKQQEVGIEDEAIKQALLKAGWEEVDVNEGFDKSQNPQQPPISNQEPGDQERSSISQEQSGVQDNIQAETNEYSEPTTENQLPADKKSSVWIWLVVLLAVLIIGGLLLGWYLISSFDEVEEDVDQESRQELVEEEFEDPQSERESSVEEVEQETLSSEEGVTKECSDYNCLIDAAKNCTQAKATLTQTAFLLFFPVYADVETYMEIVGRDDQGHCVYRQKTISIDNFFIVEDHEYFGERWEGPDQLSDIKRQVRVGVGRGHECSYPQEEFENRVMRTLYAGQVMTSEQWLEGTSRLRAGESAEKVKADPDLEFEELLNQSEGGTIGGSLYCSTYR